MVNEVCRINNFNEQHDDFYQSDEHEDTNQQERKERTKKSIHSKEISLNDLDSERKGVLYDMNMNFNEEAIQMRSEKNVQSKKSVQQQVSQLLPDMYLIIKKYLK